MAYTDPARKKANDAAYYATNRETIRKRQRAYHLTNRAERNARSAARYRAHKEEARLYNVAYHAAHRDKAKRMAAAQARTPGTYRYNRIHGIGASGEAGRKGVARYRRTLRGALAQIRANAKRRNG